MIFASEIQCKAPFLLHRKIFKYLACPGEYASLTTCVLSIQVTLSTAVFGLFQLALITL